MLLGARQFFERRGKSAPTARDYVQDGLIAMWDGIENAGWGVHDASASVWKDLIGHLDITLQDGWYFGDDFMYSVKGTRFYMGATSLTFADGGTIETVVEPNDFSSPLNRNNIVGPAAGSGLEVVCCPSGIGFRFQTYGEYPKIDCALGDVSIASSFTWNETGLTIGYLNGTEMASSQNSGMRSAGLYLGVNGTPWENNGVTGKRHNMRIYSRALTAAEIAHNYAIDKARFNLP